MALDVDKILAEAKREAEAMKGKSPLEIMAEAYDKGVETGVKKLANKLAVANEKYAEALAEKLGISKDEFMKTVAYKNYTEKVATEEGMKRILTKYIAKTQGQGKKVVERWKNAMLRKVE